MDYRYNKIKDNGDTTSNYDIIGKFPAKFIDFFNWVLNNDSSFIIKFSATNERYGGWLGNRLEVRKDRNNKHYWTKQEPENWFCEIADKNITECWVNGGWGQMIYFCTFDET